jgi:hypothetical protein
MARPKLETKKEAVEIVVDSKLDKISALIKERATKLFDQEPRGSLKDNAVDQLAKDIIDSI